MSPVRPENRARYPADWRQISARIRNERAGGQCECTGQCGSIDSHYDRGRCTALNGGEHPVTASLVVLTCAHLNHQPEDCRDENLLALCQRCHLRYDAAHHAETAARTRAAALAETMEPLW